MSLHFDILSQINGLSVPCVWLSSGAESVDRARDLAQLPNIYCIATGPLARAQGFPRLQIRLTKEGTAELLENADDEKDVVIVLWRTASEGSDIELKAAPRSPTSPGVIALPKRYFDRGARVGASAVELDISTWLSKFATLQFEQLRIGLGAYDTVKVHANTGKPNHPPVERSYIEFKENLDPNSGLDTWVGEKICNDLPALINATPQRCQTELWLGVNDDGLDVGLSSQDLAMIQMDPPCMFPRLTKNEFALDSFPLSRDLGVLRVSVNITDARLQGIYIKDWSKSRCVLSPLDVWHRLASFPAALLHALRSPSTVRILFHDGDVPPEKMLRGIGNYDFVITPANMDANCINVINTCLRRPSDAKWAIVAFNTAKEWSKFVLKINFPGNVYNVVYVIPAGLQTSSLREVAMQPNVQYIVAAGGPEEYDAGNSLQMWTCPYGHLVFREMGKSLEHVPPGEDLMARAKRWLVGDEAPSFLLAELGAVAWTSHAEAIVNVVRQELGRVRPGRFTSVGVCGELRGVGVSAAMRSAALELAEPRLLIPNEQFHVVWLTHLMPKEDIDSLVTLFHKLAGQPVVFFSDVLEVAGRAEKCITAALEHVGSVHVVLVRAGPPAGGPIINIPARCTLKDIKAVASVLESLFTSLGDNDAARAIDCARRDMEQLKEESYMCVLTMAATQREYLTAAEWVKRDIEAGKRNPYYHPGAVEALAMVAAFAETHRFAMPLPFDPKNKDNARDMKLISWVPDHVYRVPRYRFVHPYFARVFLLVTAEAATAKAPFPQPRQLLNVWKRVVPWLVHVLRAEEWEPEFLSNVIRGVLWDRNEGVHRLAPLGEWLVQQNSSELFEEFVKIPDEGKYMQVVHTRVAVSRVLRYAGNTKQALEAAKEALDAVKGAKADHHLTVLARFNYCTALRHHALTIDTGPARLPFLMEGQGMLKNLSPQDRFDCAEVRKWVGNGLIGADDAVIRPFDIRPPARTDVQNDTATTRARALWW